MLFYDFGEKFLEFYKQFYQVIYYKNKILLHNFVKDYQILFYFGKDIEKWDNLYFNDIFTYCLWRLFELIPLITSQQNS